MLLPHLGTNYRRPESAERISRSELGLPENGYIYLAPHSTIKLHPEFDGLLASIAELDSQAKFVMFEDSTPFLTRKLCKRMTQRFDQQGIELTRHLVWLPRVPISRFRSVLSASDVLLDTPWYSGGNISLDAIGQGLPLITIPSDSMRSRQSAAMLRMWGAGELIATLPKDFVDLALRVTREKEYASGMRQQLLEAGAALFDDDRPLTTLVECLETP